MTNGENVRVVVRCRPLIPSETQSGHHLIVKTFPNDNALNIQAPDNEIRSNKCVSKSMKFGNAFWNLQNA